MNKRSKKIVIVSASLMACGVILGGAGFAMGGYPGVQISRHGIFSTSTKSEPCELAKTKLDSFSKVKISVDSYADIQILPSDDNSFYLEYLLDRSYGEPEYQVKDDILTVHHNNQGVGFINLTFETFDTLPDTHIQLYVPEGKVLDYLDIYNDSGDVMISDVHVKDSKISIDYGDLTLNNSDLDSLDLHLDSGDFITDDTEISILNLQNEYGDNTLNNYKGSYITADLDSCSLMIDAVELDSLECDIEYGDVNLALPGKLDTYTFDISTEYGDILLPKSAPRGYFTNRNDDSEVYYQTDGDGKHMIQVKADSGDVSVSER